MHATTLPVEQVLQRLVAADSQAAIFVREQLETVDPAYGLDPAYGVQIEDLPCQVLDADLWFADTPTELEEAKSHCGGCPVRLGCLAGALTRREPWGVWGGEIFEQGTVIERKRPRGRPRKNAVAA